MIIVLLDILYNSTLDRNNKIVYNVTMKKIILGLTFIVLLTDGTT